MSEYYGVQRSTSLSHYGVKGMKWGVRKAIASGNSRRIQRQYAKASKKLAKLNERANIGAQRAKYNAWNKMAKKAAIIGGIAGGLGSMTGVVAGGLRDRVPLASMVGTSAGRKVIGLYGASGAAGAALGSYIGKKARAQVYKNRMSESGHAKAVAKRDEFKREMDAAFKGAKNVKNNTANKSKVKSKKPSTFKQDLKDAGKAAALSLVIGPAANMYMSSRQAVRDNPGTRKKTASNSSKLKAEALSASKRSEDAYNNLSALGKRGYGKTAKAYREANRAAAEATRKYYNSLSKKDYAKLRRNHIG